MSMTEAIHVYPLNDYRDHCVDGGNCWCRPRVLDDGEDTIVVHNSMDRREEHEQGRAMS